MRAQPQPEELNGEPVRRPARRARVPPAGLYRYVPVPPAYYDDDGYLVEDGMTYADRHSGQTAYWHYALKRRLPTATVCRDLAVHYREGDRNAAVVPDLFVALRAPPLEDRSHYQLWRYPLPELVIEMLSKTTWKEDVGRKRDTYEYLGVREYWLFDPEGWALSTPLTGYRLRDSGYRPIGADAAGACRSRVLGMALHVLAGDLRFRDPETGENLSTYEESMNRAEAAKAKTAAERARTEAAEREWAALRAKTAAERARAEAAEREWAALRARADAAERELARLRLRLEGS